MHPRLHAELERLYASTDFAAYMGRDPVAFAHRYQAPGDQERAATLAALLAFGKVDLFRPVLARLFDHMDAAGGPAAWVASFDAEAEAEFLATVQYRWVRGGDLSLLFATLRDVGLLGPRVEAAFRGDLRAALTEVVADLRRRAVQHACLPGFGDLSHGLRHLLASPATGGASKRWNLLLRWMVRSPDAEGVDLGLWKLPTSALVIPLDTHVARISRLVGLTARRSSGWKTAVEITEALATLDPSDPLRFDFAIAHLGISRACEGRFVDAVCPGCPLHRVCAATMV